MVVLPGSASILTIGMSPALVSSLLQRPSQDIVCHDIGSSSPSAETSEFKHAAKQHHCSLSRRVLRQVSINSEAGPAMHAQRCCHGCLCRHAWAQEMIAALGLLRAASALWAFNAGPWKCKCPAYVPCRWRQSSGCYSIFDCLHRADRSPPVGLAVASTELGAPGRLLYCRCCARAQASASPLMTCSRALPSGAPVSTLDAKRHAGSC